MHVLLRSAFSLLCHFDVGYIVRVEEKSRVVFIEYIYMPLHHAQMCMFARLPFGLLGVNRLIQCVGDSS